MHSAIILGVNGYLGCHLSNSLVAQGCKVYGFGRSRAKNINLSPSVNYFGVDIFSLDFENIIAKLDAEVIFDFTYIVPPNNFCEISSMQISLDKYAHLVSKVFTGRHIIFTSSGGTVYGFSEENIQEERRVSPKLPYAICKVEQEKIIQTSEASYDILRLTNPYGGLQKVKNGIGFIAQTIHCARQRREMLFTVPQETKRDYIHIDDVVEIYSKFGLEKINLGVTNISTGKATRLIDIVDLVYSHFGMNYKDYLATTNNVKDGFSLINSLCNKKLINITGKKKFNSIEEGLSAVLNSNMG